MKQLTHHQVHTLTHALRVAATQFFADSDKFRGANMGEAGKRAAEQFRRHGEEARDLAELIEWHGGIALTRED